MVRPKKLRKVSCLAAGRGFKPIGRPVNELKVATLRLDELEALRLADVLGLYHEAAAQQMGVSRPTFSRILTRARSTVAGAVVNEHLLVVGDGPVTAASQDPFPCPIHGAGPRRGRGCRCHRGGGRVSNTNQGEEP